MNRHKKPKGSAPYMTDAQARRLGRLLAQARQRKGLTTRQVAEGQDFTHVWVHRIERGEYHQPTPHWLWRLAELLDLDPTRIDRLTSERLTHSIPSLHTYFRLDRDAGDAEIAEIMGAINDIHKKYERRNDDSDDYSDNDTQRAA
jgi:transcriptional regulator with XRE-family HTH domain